MRTSRRSLFISAAQVALHYGYTLSEALALSSSERYLLLAVFYDAEEKKYDKLGEMLGTRWSMSDLIETGGPRSSEVPDRINLPLLPFMAPELFQSVAKDYREKIAASRRHSGNEPVTEVGTLSVAEARAFFKSVYSSAPEKKD